MWKECFWWRIIVSNCKCIKFIFIFLFNNLFFALFDKLERLGAKHNWAQHCTLATSGITNSHDQVLIIKQGQILKCFFQNFSNIGKVACFLLNLFFGKFKLGYYFMKLSFFNIYCFSWSISSLFYCKFRWIIFTFASFNI